ncbi:MAG: glucuronate isomerase [Acholeplasmataceae bacterium]|nr:glucuronate isomerase [Acholeplasmataceae bacterium]
MTSFIHDDFMLQSPLAKTLYHEHARHMPIIDFHCHLNPKDIYLNRTFANLYELWLEGDHYKWRLMRAKGYPESIISGGVDPKAGFMAWATTVESLIGNPLYHWTHLELKRYFGIDTLLSPSTAKAIYDQVNALLPSMPVRTLIDMSHVETICTTDDPTDSLEWHERLQSDPTFQPRVVPAFRPDKAINIDSPAFLAWIGKLAHVANRPITSLKDLKDTMINRIDVFHDHGCRLSDHALDEVFFQPGSDQDAAMVFLDVLNGKVPSSHDIRLFKTNMLVFLGKAYYQKGWVQQYHIGALRNVSSRMLDLMGPDTGFDAIMDGKIATPLARLLDTLDETNECPKTIIYTLNPADFELAMTLTQSFPSDGVSGKIQFGAAWWFLDNIDGMTRQIKTLANNGSLSSFVGMLTDSRSFVSYPRHEYFRRLLSNILADEVNKGYFPNDPAILSKIIKDISYHNAKSYFNFV